MRLNLFTPWDYWTFLKGVPRLKVLMHSIHYLDLIRYLAGEPCGVYCKGVRHPAMPDYADTRTSSYSTRVELCASLTMNHAHSAGPRRAMCELKIEGTQGAAIAKMGVNLNYPKGEPDTLEVALTNGEWTDVPLRGSWFLKAFEGPISNIQRFAAEKDATLVSDAADAIRTMALVEACYDSSARGATPIPSAD